MKAVLYFLMVFGLSSSFALAQGDDEPDTNYGNWVNEEQCPITKAKIDQLSSPALRERIRQAVGNDEAAIQSELQDEADVLMTEIYLCSRFQLPMEAAVVDFALAQSENDYQRELRGIDQQVEYIGKMLKNAAEEDKAPLADLLRLYARQKVQAKEQNENMRQRFLSLRQGIK